MQQLFISAAAHSLPHPCAAAHCRVQYREGAQCTAVCTPFCTDGRGRDATLSCADHVHSLWPPCCMLRTSPIARVAVGRALREWARTVSDTTPQTRIPVVHDATDAEASQALVDWLRQWGDRVPALDPIDIHSSKAHALQGEGPVGKLRRFNVGAFLALLRTHRAARVLAYARCTTSTQRLLSEGAVGVSDWVCFITDVQTVGAGALRGPAPLQHTHTHSPPALRRARRELVGVSTWLSHVLVQVSRRAPRVAAAVPVHCVASAGGGGGLGARVRGAWHTLARGVPRHAHVWSPMHALHQTQSSRCHWGSSGRTTFTRAGM